MILFDCIYQTTGTGFRANEIATLILSIIAIGVTIWNYNQVLKIERFKNDLQKQLNVHKLQFDKEFDIYKEISGQLNILRSKIDCLNTDYIIVPLEIRNDEIVKRIDDLALEGNKLIDITGANRPFYSEEIYQELRNINSIVKNGIIQVRIAYNNGKYWDGGTEAIEAYSNLQEKINNSIRNRIKSMIEIN